jgi:molecular chaperone GrpE
MSRGIGKSRLHLKENKVARRRIEEKKQPKNVEETVGMKMETPENQDPILDTDLPLEVEVTEVAEETSAALQAELEAAKARAQEATDQYVRLLAEFDNFRKRSRREYESLQEYASEKVLISLLPVLDDFDRTLTAMEKTDNLASIKDGINMVTNKLHRTLEKEGLNLIDTKDADFDSGLHEAIHSIEVDAAQKGKVLEQAEKGYRLKDKVIRFAKVIVGE